MNRFLLVASILIFRQIDQLIHDVSFDDRTNSAWNKVRVELGQLADA
jgi:hypothetical protein